MTTKQRTYRCDRCGRRHPAERMVFSRWTRARYCRDIDMCARRAKRRDK